MGCIGAWPVIAGQVVVVSSFELKELWPLRMVCRGWDEAVRLFFELHTEKKCFEEGNVVDDLGGDYPNHFTCRFKPKGQRAATSKELLAECIRVVEKRIPKSEQDPAFSRDRYGLIHLQLPQFRDFKKQLKEKKKFELYVEDECQMIGWQYEQVKVSWAFIKKSPVRSFVSRLAEMVEELQNPRSGELKYVEETRAGAKSMHEQVLKLMLAFTISNRGQGLTYTRTTFEIGGEASIRFAITGQNGASLECHAEFLRDRGNIW